MYPLDWMEIMMTSSLGHSNIRRSMSTMFSSAQESMRKSHLEFRKSLFLTQLLRILSWENPRDLNYPSRLQGFFNTSTGQQWAQVSTINLHCTPRVKRSLCLCRCRLPPRLAIFNILGTLIKHRATDTKGPMIVEYLGII
jgi:hypothetical protein